MSDRVTCTIAGGVADVRLNRPEKLNALDPETFAALVETGEALKTNPSVRAVVLSGEGRGFCAGLDFDSFRAMAGQGDASRVAITRPPGQITNSGQQAVYVWTEMPVPVIAAVHGVALGGGLQIALGADLRIVAPDARLSILEVRWGLTPDMTGTAMLPRLVGLDVAKELTWTGRMVSGEEAVRIGLATRTSDHPHEDALALASELAAKSPAAVKGAKVLLNQAGSVSLEEQFRAEEQTLRSMAGSPNQREAVLAYFEKREPVFADE
jgi:enoyl-CoA hydratase/carnithine racemase